MLNNPLGATAPAPPPPPFVSFSAHAPFPVPPPPDSRTLDHPGRVPFEWCAAIYVNSLVGCVVRTADASIVVVDPFGTPRAVPVMFELDAGDALPTAVVLVEDGHDPTWLNDRCAAAAAGTGYDQILYLSPGCVDGAQGGPMPSIDQCRRCTDRDDLEALVVALCRLGPLTLDEAVHAVGRGGVGYAAVVVASQDGLVTRSSGNADDRFALAADWQRAWR